MTAAHAPSVQQLMCLIACAGAQQNSIEHFLRSLSQRERLHAPSLEAWQTAVGNAALPGLWFKGLGAGSVPGFAPINNSFERCGRTLHGEAHYQWHCA